MQSLAIDHQLTPLSGMASPNEKWGTTKSIKLLDSLAIVLPGKKVGAEAPCTPSDARFVYDTSSEDILCVTERQQHGEMWKFLQPLGYQNIVKEMPPVTSLTKCLCSLTA